MKAILALLLLLVSVPAHAQSSWCAGANCPAVSPDTARWMYEHDPERAREKRERKTIILVCVPAFRSAELVCTEVRR